MADNLHIQNPSITSGTLASMFAFSAGTDIITAISGHPVGGIGGGGGGTPTEGYWRPIYNDNKGDLSWLWSIESTANTPTPANIKGPSGTNGKDGKDGANGISPTFTITPTAGGTHVTISGAQGEDSFDVLSGAKGADGANGANGISPTISTSPAPTTTHPQGGTHVVISGADGEHEFDVWNGADGAGATNYFDSTTISGAGTQASEYGLKTDAAMYLSNTSAYSATYAEQYWDEVEHQYLTISNIVNYLDTTKVDIPSGTGTENKYWLYNTFGGQSTWTEANSWLCNNFICENGISGIPDMALCKMHIGLSAEYLPLSGGTVSGSTYFSAANGQNMLAVASAATLIGASRQTSEHFGQDTTALGTTWIGVGGAGMYRGFLKYTQGGNVGDLDSNNTMQVEFTPNNKGTIFAKAKNSGNDCPETQILNPTKASCDAMTQSANANLVSGPNYMLAKNADGQFVIGAACINCTAINDVTLAPNTYYFVYEV